MSELSNFWQSGGLWMYPIAMAGVGGLAASLGLGIVALLAKDGSRDTLRLSGVLLAFGVVTALLGVAGWLTGMRQVEQAVAMVNPADAETIYRAGSAEAKSPLILGLVLALPSVFVGLAVLGLGVARLPRAAPPARPS